MLVCEIHTSGSRCVIFSVFYRSPNADKVLLDGFRTYLHKFNDTGISDLIITGDFNFSQIDWSTISPTNLNSQVESFCDILNGFVTRPCSTTGYNESILNLVLTTLTWTKAGNYLEQNMGFLRKLYGNYMAWLKQYFKIS